MLSNYQYQNKESVFTLHDTLQSKTPNEIIARNPIQPGLRPGTFFDSFVSRFVGEATEGRLVGKSKIVGEATEGRLGKSKGKDLNKICIIVYTLE